MADPAGSCIWYVSKYVAPLGGSDGKGVGSRGYELMRELALRGHQCVVVTSDANHLAEVPKLTSARLVQRRDGLMVCWLRTMKSKKSKSLRRIGGWLHFEWRLLRLDTRSLPCPDVIIASSPSLLTILSALVLRRRLRASLIFEVRDIWPLTLVDEGGFSPRNPFVLLLGAIERLAYRRADAIVGTMPNLGEHVARVLGSARPVDCIPMGYSARAIAHEVAVPESFVETYLPRDRFTVVYAGTIGISNALEPFFAAAEKMQDRTDVHFLVMGDGTLLPRYRRQFDRLPNLTFAPKIVKDSVPSLLRRCDLLYLSTRPAELWRYGQSLNKLVDYMLAGRPVLASFSGFPSMIDEAGCGTLVPSEDVEAIIEAVQHYVAMSASEREAIGRRGRDWILEHREYARLAGRYETILVPEA